MASGTLRAARPRRQARVAPTAPRGAGSRAPRGRPRAVQRIDWPSALAASSTAIAALPFSRSRIGFTSTSSSEPTNPDSARSSHARCASRYVSPPFTGVPTPGAISGSSASRSIETWTKPGPDARSIASSHDPLDPDPVDLGHRDRANALLPDQRALRGVERAHADEHDALGVDGGQLEAVPREGVPRNTQGCSERHPVDVPRRARGRRVEVAVRVDPDDAPGLPRGAAQARQRPERDRMIAAEDDRHSSIGDDVADDPCQPGARLQDLGQEPCARVRHRQRLGLGRRHVAPVHDPAAEGQQPLLEPGVPDRRGAHVHAAPALTEVEWRSDDRDGLRRRSHGAEATAIRRPSMPRRLTLHSLGRGSSVGRAHG